MKTAQLLSISVSQLRQSITVLSLSSGFRIKRFKPSKVYANFLFYLELFLAVVMWYTFRKWKYLTPYGRTVTVCATCYNFK